MIKECSTKDINELVILAKEIYHNSSKDELIEEFRNYLNHSNQQILLWTDVTEIVGFAQFSIRNDYVEGTHSNPCGYLEGVFVKETYRHQQIARKLVHQGQRWTEVNGCSEFASDCEIDNVASLSFHQKIGFKEVSRTIHF